MKPQTDSLGGGIKSAGRGQQHIQYSQKNKKDKSDSFQRVSLVSFSYIYALIFECIYSKINVLRPEGKVCGSKTDDANGVCQITGGYSK